MKILAQTIFSEFKDKVLDPSYFPTHSLATLNARLTATWLLQSNNAERVKQAKAFILKTSFFKEEDLSRLEQFASQVKSLNELDICSTYANTRGNFLEYKLSF